MPRAFGSFRDAPTLGCVCDDCNLAMGKEVELHLARGTGEGLRRYLLGQRNPEEIENLRRGSLQLTLTSGFWQGLRVDIAYDENLGELVIVPLAQVGFRRRDGDGYAYMLLEELTEEIRRREDLDFDARVLLFANDPAREKALALLEGLGIHVRLSDEPLPDPAGNEDTVEVEITTKIDERLRRAIAKIAFNYLTFLTEPGFVLQTSFDQIRKYIRYGVDPGFRLVRASDEPVLSDDTRSDRQTNAHLVKLNWDATGIHLLGWISLFNSVTFSVVLSRIHQGVYRPDIVRGHAFDWTTGEVSELARISRRIFLPRWMLRRYLP